MACKMNTAHYFFFKRQMRTTSGSADTVETVKHCLLPTRAPCGRCRNRWVWQLLLCEKGESTIGWGEVEQSQNPGVTSLIVFLRSPMLWRHDTNFSQRKGNTVIVEIAQRTVETINLCIWETSREGNVFLPLSGKLTWNTSYVYWHKKDVYNNIKSEVWQNEDLFLIIRQLAQPKLIVASKVVNHIKAKTIFVCL